MALRCWPGCIARVNEQARLAVNVGALVEVVELAPTGCFELPGWPAGFNPSDEPRWIVRTVSRALVCRSAFHGIHEADTACCADAALTPISPPPPPAADTTPAAEPRETEAA